MNVYDPVYRRSGQKRRAERAARRRRVLADRQDESMPSLVVDVELSGIAIPTEPFTA